MKQVFRVKDKKELENKIEDKLIEGYKLISQTDRQSELIKRSYGKAIWHIVFFLLTVWWTLGLINLFYLVYSYFTCKDEVIIKIK